MTLCSALKRPINVDNAKLEDYVHVV